MVNQAHLYKEINRGQIEDGKALLNYADPKPGELVLDIGCGTGELTFELAQKVGPAGKIVALDPDIERIQIAKKTQPIEIKNIEYINNYFTSDIIPAKPTYDLIYSNHVFHWFKHKENEVQLTFDCLKPGGRFAIQFVYALPECLSLIREMVGKPLEISSNLRELWLCYFDSFGLKYEIKSGISPYYHPDIDDLLAWYEGTTHGLVKRSDLSGSQIEELHKKYPGEIHITHPTLRLIGYKV